MNEVEFELFAPLGTITLQVPTETEPARMICQHTVAVIIDTHVQIPKPVRPQWRIVLHESQKGLFYRFEETVSAEVRFILTKDDRFKNKIGVQLHDAYLEDKKPTDYELGNKG